MSKVETHDVEYKVVYKCRMCGAITTSNTKITLPVTRFDDKVDLLKLSTSIHDNFDIEKYSNNTPYHSCKDGNLGIVEVIGLKKIK